MMRETDAFLKLNTVKQLIFSILFLVLQATLVNAQIKAPNALTVSQGFENPIGFYDNTPTFSWKLPALKNVLSQTAYRIVVATSPDLLPDQADLWDSTKQETDTSIFVKYKGTTLQSRQKIYWQVKYWNQDEQPSSWSAVNTIEFGLLENADWKAQWVGLNTAKDSIKGVRKFLMHRPQYLRKKFKLSSKVASARLYITAKGVFDVHLNGKDVSDDVMTPGWTPYNHRIETITYNVTQLLKKGKNAIAVELASGWHSGRISRGRALYENFASPKILCQLEVTMKDGSKQTIVSDASWKGTTNGPIRLASIYDGELYDANFEIQDWNTIAFNDEKWESVETEALSNTVKLAPKRHHTVKNQVILNDVEIVSIKENASVFNVKQNIVGVPRLKVPMKKGDTLKIRFSEMLLKDNVFYTKNYRSAKSTDYYIAAKDGVIEYTPKFTFHGFQYIELSGYDKNAKPDASWVQGIAQHSNFKINGTFTSSHKKLNQLQQNITWGLRDNFFDIPTDCPQRDERLGWTGDAQVIAPTALFNYSTHAFWTAWLQSLRENQSEHKNGLVPYIVPDVLQNKNGSSGWGDACVIIPWDIYNITGDLTILEESYESAKKWLGYYKSKIRKKPYIPVMHSFGDWLQPYPSKSLKKANRGDTPKELINTAHFAHSAHLISKIAGVLGKADDEKKYKTLYNAIANAFENEFFDENARFKQERQTQTSYLLGLHFGLFKAETKLKAQNHLLEEIKNTDYHLGTGFLGTPILPKVLDNMGEIDIMYKILFKETYPSWFYSINQGATTMWERWNSFSKAGGYNSQSMNSLNHYAYGAIGQWLYERIAGIAPIAPGYKIIKIAPKPRAPLTSASATVETPYGNIKSSWRKEKETYSLEIRIPPNTTAEVELPFGEIQNITINGTKIDGNSSIKILNSTSQNIKFLVQPGDYSIQTKI